MILNTASDTLLVHRCFHLFLPDSISSQGWASVKRLGQSSALFCWSCWWKNLWNLNVSDKQTHSTVVHRFALNKTKPQVSEVKLHFDAPSQWTSNGANFFFHRRTIHSCQSQQAHIYKLKVRRVQQWSVHMAGCLILSFFSLEPWQTLSLQ